MSFRILFHANSHKRTLSLTRKPTSLQQIYNDFHHLYPELSHISDDLLREKLQYFDQEFEEWVDLINLNELPENKVKIRFVQDTKAPPKNKQADYSFRRTFGEFKSNVDTLKGGAVEAPRSTSSMSLARPKSALRSRTAVSQRLSSEESDPDANSEGSGHHQTKTTTSKRPQSAGASRRRALISQLSRTDDDSQDSTAKPTYKLSKRKNYTKPITPMVLQRSLQYRDQLLAKAEKRKKSAKRKKVISAQPSVSASYNRDYFSAAHSPSPSSFSSSLHVPPPFIAGSTSLSTSFSTFSNMPSTRGTPQRPGTPSGTLSSHTELKNTILLDARAKKQQQIASALEELKIYNPALREKFYSLQVFEPNVPVPVHKILDTLWDVDTQTSITIAKQLEARGLLKYENHHIIIQTHHHSYLQNQHGDPYHLHKQFLESLSSFCQASNVRFRRPSVEQLEADHVSIDEVNWCTFDDGAVGDSGRKYFFKQLPYHLVGSKKFHLLAQLLLRPAYLLKKIALWKEAPQVVLRDFTMLEDYGMSSKAHTQLKEALVMSLDYLKNNDHELPSQLLGRLSVSKLPVIQSYLETFMQLMKSADYSWIKPLKYSGLYHCNSGIRLISAPGGCVVTDFKDYIFNAHGKVAFQRNIHTGLVEKHFPVLDENCEIVALAVTPKRDKLIAAIVTHMPDRRSSDAATGGIPDSVSTTSNGSNVTHSRVHCSLRVWDIATGNHLRHIEAEQDTHFINKLICTKDGKYVITANKIPVKDHLAHHHVKKDKAERRFREMHYAIQVFDIQKGVLLKYFKGHTSPVVDLCISPSGQYLVSASRKSIRVWDCMNLNVALRKQLMEFRINSNPKVKVKQFPLTGRICLDNSTQEDRFIYAATENGVLKLDFEGNFVAHLAEGLDSIRCLAYDALHEHLVLGLQEHYKVEVWNIDEDDIVREYKDFLSPATAIQVVGDHYLVDTGVDYRYFLSTRDHTTADHITCVSDVCIAPVVDSKGQLSSGYRLLAKSQPNPEAPQGAVASFDLVTGERHTSFAFIEGDAYLSCSPTTAAIRSMEANNEYSIKVIDLTNNGQLLQQVVLQEPCYGLKVSRNGEFVYYISPDEQHLVTLHVESNRITETDLKLKIGKLFLCAADRFVAVVPKSDDKRPLLLVDTKTNSLVTNRNAMPYVNRRPNYFCSQNTNWIWIHSGQKLEIYDVIHDAMIYVFDAKVENIVHPNAKDNAQFSTFSSFTHLDQYLVAASYKDKKLYVYCTAQSDVKVPRDASQFISSRPVESDGQGNYKMIHVLRCHLVASYTMDGHITSVDAVRIGNKLHFACGIESCENSLAIAEMVIREDELMRVSGEMSRHTDYRNMAATQETSDEDELFNSRSMGSAKLLEIPKVLPDISHIPEFDYDEGFGLESPSYFKELDEAMEDY